MSKTIEAGRALHLVVWAFVLICGSGSFGHAYERTRQEGGEPPAPMASAAVMDLMNQARKQYDAQDYEGGLATSKLALALARSTKDVPGEANAENGSANCLMALRRFPEAISAYAAAAEAWKRAKEGPYRVVALVNGAFLCLGTERGAQMLEEAEAVAESEKQTPNRMLRILDNVMVRAVASNRPQIARLLGKAVVHLFRLLPPGSLEEAGAYHNMGVLNWNQDRLPNAEVLFAHGLLIYEQREPDSLDVAMECHWLGTVDAAFGDYVSARAYHERALAIRSKKARGSMLEAESLQALGNLLLESGDLSLAQEHLVRALLIAEDDARKTGERTHRLAAILGTLATVENERGDTDAALLHLQQSLSIDEKAIGKGSPEVAGTLDNLGIVYKDRGELSQAETYQRKALAIYQAVLPDSQDMAICQNSLGMTFLAEHNLSDAEQNIQAAQECAEKIAPGSPFSATLLVSRGEIAKAQGKGSTAQDFYRQALAIQEKLLPGSLTLARTLNDAATLEADPVKAEVLYVRAWAIVRNQGARVVGDEAQQAYSASAALFAGNLARIQMERGEQAQAFATMEEGRAQALERLLTDRNIMGRIADPRRWRDYQQAIAAQNLAERNLAHLTAVSHSPEEEARIQQAEEAYTEARTLAERRWAEVRAGVPRNLLASPLDLAKARGTLVPGDLLLLFMTDDQGITLLAVGAGTDPKAILSAPVRIPVERLQELVGALGRKASSENTPESEVASAGRALFAALFPEEVANRIRTARRLILSPDGILWHVPWAALPLNAEGPPQYLGLSKPFTLIQSLSVYARSRNEVRSLRPGQHPTALVFGSCLFTLNDLAIAAQKAHKPGPLPTALPLELATLQHLFGTPHPLPESKTEAVNIAQLYGTKPHLALDATEAVFRSLAATADVIHLSTHGQYHAKRPMSSGILLTLPLTPQAPGTTTDDGILQAWEIYYFPQRLRAELVVLSTCQSGEGDAHSAEGIIGLTRSLQFAGVRSIVSSQWPVEDKSTAVLLLAFHRRLLQGQDKAEALRLAMKDMAQGANSLPAWRRPYYWAPFFLTGDPENPNLRQ